MEETEKEVRLKTKRCVFAFLLPRRSFHTACLPEMEKAI